eukprot:Em0337g6a
MENAGHSQKRYEQAFEPEYPLLYLEAAGKLFLFGLERKPSFRTLAIATNSRLVRPPNHYALSCLATSTDNAAGSPRSKAWKHTWDVLAAHKGMVAMIVVLFSFYVFGILDKYTAPQMYPRVWLNPSLLLVTLYLTPTKASRHGAGKSSTTTACRATIRLRAILEVQRTQAQILRQQPCLPCYCYHTQPLETGAEKVHNDCLQPRACCQFP